MEPEYFQYLLLMLLAMGKARPQNFLQLLSSPSSVSGGDTGEELVLGKMMPSLMEQLETQVCHVILQWLELGINLCFETLCIGVW